MTTIGITRNHVRGVTFLSNGQRYEGWVPKGTYAVVGACWLSRDGRSNQDMSPAVKIQHDKEGTWYIGRHVVCSCGMVNCEGKDNTPVEHDARCVLWSAPQCHQEG
jgi:hypothetical protein